MFIDIFTSEKTKAKGFVEFLIYFMFFYGCYCVLHKVWRFMKVFWQHFCRGCCKSKTHMYEKFGRAGSWALVTGGSDGIGLEMCH
jgi:hypothetical protein